MIEALLLSSAMVVATMTLHFVGLAILIALMNFEFARRIRAGSAFMRALTLLGVALGLVVVHAVEIWSYAAAYLTLGAVPDIEEALYFSTTTFSTVGYGDVTLRGHWRLVAAIEGANGFLLIGWSTAFLVTVTARMGLLESQLMHDERPRDMT